MEKGFWRAVAISFVYVLVAGVVWAAFCSALGIPQPFGFMGGMAIGASAQVFGFLRHRPKLD